MSLVILIAEEYDAYIIVSFVNATLVLSIGETVEEVTDSGFLGTTPTLSCSALGEDALVQVFCILQLYIALYSAVPRIMHSTSLKSYLNRRNILLNARNIYIKYIVMCINYLTKDNSIFLNEERQVIQE